MSSHRNTELNRGLYQVYLWLNRQSTEGKGESCSWFCSTSEETKRTSPFQEIAEKSRVSTFCGSPYRGVVSCIINDEVVLAASGRGRNWLIRGTVTLRRQGECHFEPRVYLSIIVLAMPFLKYNFKVYMKLILSAYLLSRWCGLLCFGNYHRQNVPLECHYWKFSLVWSIKVGVGLLERKF